MCLEKEKKGEQNCKKKGLRKKQRKWTKQKRKNENKEGNRRKIKETKEREGKKENKKRTEQKPENCENPKTRARVKCRPVERPPEARQNSPSQPAIYRSSESYEPKYATLSLESHGLCN